MNVTLKNISMLKQKIQVQNNTAHLYDEKNKHLIIYNHSLQQTCMVVEPIQLNATPIT